MREPKSTTTKDTVKQPTLIPAPVVPILKKDIDIPTTSEYVSDPTSKCV